MSQRATARLLGVDKETVRGDLGLKHLPGENSPPAPTDRQESEENELFPEARGENSPPDWFQAEFVLWWDTQAEKAQGQRTDLQHRRGSATKLQAGKAGIPERYVIDRWRRKLKGPGRFPGLFGALDNRVTHELQ